ncbi:TPA: hypothetical protein ACKONU_003568 [Clostridioides difficile]
MNILAITMLIIGSFIAGRVYEYRLNLKECENCDNKRGEIMITTQMYKINNEIYLDNLCLEENKEMTIWVEKKNTHELIWLKIANVNGKLAIFVQNVENAVIKEWQGRKEYERVLGQIEDKQVEKGEILYEEY